MYELELPGVGADPLFGQALVLLLGYPGSEAVGQE
jgi:hypothetical protein